MLAAYDRGEDFLGDNLGVGCDCNLIFTNVIGIVVFVWVGVGLGEVFDELVMLIDEVCCEIYYFV